MTRANPIRVQPSTVRVWRLYRVWRADGVLLYIGITGREPLARLIEHLYEQQWASEIARWEVDPLPYASEAEVLAAEEFAIRVEKPIRNWTHNDGPHRQWQPKVGSYRHPGRRAAVQRPDRWREVAGSPWPWWAAGWLVVALAVGWVTGEVGQDWSLRGRFWTAVIVASVTVGVVRWRWRVWLRRLKRAWR